MSSVDCATCHDPHLSLEKGDKFLLPVKHAPFISKDCTTCHLPGSNEVKDRAPGLCVDCHNDFAGIMTAEGLHGAMNREGSCLGCHAPHAGYEGVLVRPTQQETCFQCHDRKPFAKEVKHKPVQEACTGCHQPHAAGQPNLLLQTTMELCLSCHEQHPHPVGGDYLDPRTGRMLTCVSCHDPHSSDYDSLLTYDQSRELCIQCHVGGMGAR